MTSKKADIIIPENVRTIVTKYILHFNIDLLNTINHIIIIAKLLS
jgi:hypothetical protein